MAKKKKTKKLPITLCVITHNSEDRIQEMIKKHDFCSEVLVVVQESTDDTLARAREVADCVIERRCKGTSDPDRNWLFSMANNPWVLYLDDDEHTSKELNKKLPDLLKQNVAVYWTPRTNLVDGVDIFKILKHDMQPRLFQKGSLNFPSKIHSYPRVDKKAFEAFVDYPIVHERTLDQVRRSNRDRNIVADKDSLALQEKFIAQVEELVGNANV